MAKKKKKKRPTKTMERNIPTISYVCSNCGCKEDIPEDVLEYFDEVNPQQLLYGAHEFKCENCDSGIMKPESDVKPIVRGFGLFEELKFN